MRICYSTLLIILVSGFVSWSSATTINETEALNKARLFYSQPLSGLRGGDLFTLAYVGRDSLTKTADNDGQPRLYVFNVGDNHGFVMVSADNAVKPILAYSHEGTFPSGNFPDNLKKWIDFYQKEISQAIELAPLNKTAIDGTTQTLRSTSAVSPLLGKIAWNQDDPFNLLCPYSATYSERTPTGCVATAMAQIMDYYKWPAKGSGSHTYTFNLNSKSTTLKANFALTTYHWDNMLDYYGSNATKVQDTAVATLMYHCGVATEMKYDIANNGGSSAGVDDAGIALKTYFGYDSDIQSYWRQFYSKNDWQQLIKNELDAGRPILYSGSNESGGHAFVCDGYDSDGLFHINWGWGGSANGYYELSALLPSSSGTGGSDDGYAQNQIALMGIQKENGVAQTTTQLGTYGMGLTSSKTAISNINSEKLDVSFGFLNYGINSFSGLLGLVAYKDGSPVKTLIQGSLSNLFKYYGTDSTSFSDVSLSGLSSGNYQLYLTWEPTGGASWNKVLATAPWYSYLDLTINGSSATLKTPSTTSALALASQIQPDGNQYTNKTGRFNIQIKNEGDEFYSNLNLYLYSASDTSVHQFLGQQTVNFIKNETKDLSFTGIIKLKPGNYYAVAMFDSSNLFSTNSYTLVGQSTLPICQFTVLNEPASPSLSLKTPLSWTAGDTINQNDQVELSANVANNGGFFDSEMIAFIFPSTGGYSLSYLGPKTIFIDTTETKSVNLKGSINLDPGKYYAVLYYYNNSDWNLFTRSDSAYITFTIAQPKIVVPADEDSTIQLTVNPVEDYIILSTAASVLKAEIYDLSGHLMSRSTGLKEIPASYLRKGFYLLRVTTTNETKTIRFIKS
ncbi:MAG: thiol protease/hemagglutinin PrtT [Bacteroidota bacterium]|nr:thiol protease/hemagglutinin PrtT [Bacteroidota bacterium]